MAENILIVIKISKFKCEKYIALILQTLGQSNVISMPGKYMASNNYS